MKNTEKINEFLNAVINTMAEVKLSGLILIFISCGGKEQLSIFFPSCKILKKNQHIEIAQSVISYQKYITQFGYRLNFAEREKCIKRMGSQCERLFWQ